MALAFVIAGMAVGGVAAVLALASGAGFLAALLVYVGGGMAGMAGAVTLALRPSERERFVAVLSQAE